MKVNVVVKRFFFYCILILFSMRAMEKEVSKRPADTCGMQNFVDNFNSLSDPVKTYIILNSALFDYAKKNNAEVHKLNPHELGYWINQLREPKELDISKE